MIRWLAAGSIEPMRSRPLRPSRSSAMLRASESKASRMGSARSARSSPAGVSGRFRPRRSKSSSPASAFELLDVQGDGGLGEAERAGRLEEAPLPEHGLKSEEVARVHHVDSLFLTL